MMMAIDYSKLDEDDEDDDEEDEDSTSNLIQLLEIADPLPKVGSELKKQSDLIIKNETICYI